MITQQECILTKLLDCGTADLELLEDINYDLDDILDYLMRENCLSLHEIIRTVFNMGARDLQAQFEANREDIKAEILERIEQDKIDWVRSGEMTQEELECTEEYQELLMDLELLENGNLRPMDDVDYYLNYLDTHVYMQNIDFYRRYMGKIVDGIEYKMGWNFEEEVM